MRPALTWPAWALVATLAACAHVGDAPRLYYDCPTGMGFEVRLYEDMALIEGERGHVVLERMGGIDALQYSDRLMRAEFGLGLDERLVRLDYATIPQPVYCTRRPGPAAEARTWTGSVTETTPETRRRLSEPAVRAMPRPGPRKRLPHDPDAPVETNIRSGTGEVGPG